MDIDDTIRAFTCCIQIPPCCEKCPQQGPNPSRDKPWTGSICRQAVKDSTGKWLEYARKCFREDENGKH